MKKLFTSIKRFFQRAGCFLRRAGKKVLRTLRQPKWRHGHRGLLVLLLLAAALVLVNIGVATLETEYGWRRDYSFNGYATTGAETEKALQQMAYPVTMYLLYQGDDLDSHLLELLRRYEVLSPLVTVLPTDIAKNPGILTRFPGDLDTATESGCVIISCESTERYKVLNYDDFVTQEYNIEAGQFEYAGLAYEKTMTEALVYVTQDDIPVVGVLQGHGELTLSELEIFVSFLQSNAYDVRAVSLLAGDTLDGVGLLLIPSPQKDFSEGEVSAIAAFAREGGSLFITRDYADPASLPNYFALLKNYGVTPLNGVAVAGEEDIGSYWGELIYLLPYMNQLDMTLPLIAGDMTILLMPGASAFDTPPTPTAGLSAATVLKTGPNAYLRDPSDGTTTLEKQQGDLTGELTLAIYAHRTYATGDVSRLFALGNSTMLADEYIYQRTYNEQFLLQVVGELLPQKAISLDIMASSAFHPGLKAGSQPLGIALIVAVPLLVLALGLAILLPRRSR